MRTRFALGLVAGLSGAAIASAADGALSLGDAIQRAQDSGAATRLSGENIQRADAQSSAATAALLPRLDAQAYQTRRTSNLKAQGISFPGVPALVGPFNTFDARLTLSQTIFDVRAFMLARGAGLGADIARAQDRVTREQSASRVTLAYIYVLRAEQAVAAADADAQVARELLTLAQDQRKAGVASGVDVVRAQTLVSQDEFAQVQARTQLSSAMISLKRLVSLPQSGALRLTDGLSFAAQPLPDAGAAGHQAFEQRQELAALALRRKAREYERDAARARRLPTAGLFADYGLSANTPSENTEDTYTFGARVGMPIFSSGAISADIHSAEAGLDEAGIQLEDAQAQVEEDVHLALAQAGSAAEQVRAADATRGLAEQELTLARDRFAHGVGSNIEVVEAQGALSRARAGDIEALAAAQIARANLAAALGSASSFHLLPATPAQSPE